MTKIYFSLLIIVIISYTSSATLTPKTVAFNVAQKCAKQHAVDMLDTKKLIRGDFDAKTEKAKVKAVQLVRYILSYQYLLLEISPLHR